MPQQCLLPHDVSTIRPKKVLRHLAYAFGWNSRGNLYCCCWCDSPSPLLEEKFWKDDSPIPAHATVHTTYDVSMVRPKKVLVISRHLAHAFGWEQQGQFCTAVAGVICAVPKSSGSFRRKPPLFLCMPHQNGAYCLMASAWFARRRSRLYHTLPDLICMQHWHKCRSCQPGGGEKSFKSKLDALTKTNGYLNG